MLTPELEGQNSLTDGALSRSVQGRKKFCGNGQSAGNYHVPRADEDHSKENRPQGIAGHPVGRLSKAGRTTCTRGDFLRKGETLDIEWFSGFRRAIRGPFSFSSQTAPPLKPEQTVPCLPLRPEKRSRIPVLPLPAFALRLFAHPGYSGRIRTD